MNRRNLILGTAVSGSALTLGPTALSALEATPAASPAASPVAAGTPTAMGVHYGTVDHPFAIDSLWNVMPINPKLDTS